MGVAAAGSSAQQYKLLVQQQKLIILLRDGLVAFLLRTRLPHRVPLNLIFFYGKDAFDYPTCFATWQDSSEHVLLDMLIILKVP